MRYVREGSTGSIRSIMTTVSILIVVIITVRRKEKKKKKHGRKDRRSAWWVTVCVVKRVWRESKGCRTELSRRLISDRSRDDSRWEKSNWGGGESGKGIDWGGGESGNWMEWGGGVLGRGVLMACLRRHSCKLSWCRNGLGKMIWWRGLGAGVGGKTKLRSIKALGE